MNFRPKLRRASDDSEAGYENDRHLRNQSPNSRRPLAANPAETANRAETAAFKTAAARPPSPIRAPRNKVSGMAKLWQKNRPAVGSQAASAKRLMSPVFCLNDGSSF
jgi:hypothetical protein